MHKTVPFTGTLPYPVVLDNLNRLREFHRNRWFLEEKIASRYVSKSINTHSALALTERSEDDRKYHKNMAAKLTKAFAQYLPKEIRVMQ